MKKIILYLCCFIAAVFLIDRSFGFLFERFIFSKTYSGESGGNLNYLFQKKRDIQFLILGSSRAKNMINPAFINVWKGKGYNAGVNGVGGVLYMNSIVELALKNDIKPDAIIVQIDVRSFSISESDTRRAEITRLYPFIDQSYILQQYSRQLGYKERVKLNLRMYRYNGKVYNILTNRFRNNTGDNNGFNALTGMMTAETKNEKIDELGRFDSLKIDAMNNIIRQCRKHNIKLFVVFPPRYEDNFSEAKHLNALLSRFDYYGHCHFIDMIDIGKFPALQDRSNWKDEAHLNITGANKFTTYLNDSLASKINVFTIKVSQPVSF